MDHLGNVRFKLREAERNRGDDDYPNQTTEYKRQLIVDAAVSAVNEILMDCSDSSVEEADYLYSAVSLKLTQQVHQALQAKLLRYDIMPKANAQ